MPDKKKKKTKKESLGSQINWPGYYGGTPGAYMSSDEEKSLDERLAPLAAMQPTQVTPVPMPQQQQAGGVGQAVGGKIASEVASPLADKATAAITEKMGEGVLADTAAGAAGGALTGGMGALASDLLTKGEVDAGSLGSAALTAGLTAMAGPLGGMLGSGISSLLGFEEGTTDVDEMPYVKPRYSFDKHGNKHRLPDNPDHDSFYNYGKSAYNDKKLFKNTVEGKFEPETLKTIKKYAGPLGTIGKVIADQEIEISKKF